MIREEFEKKMSVLLDVLRCASSENRSQLMVYGSDGQDLGVWFTVKAGELYSYNVELGIGDDALVSVEGVSGDDVQGMFSAFVVNTTVKLHLSVVI